MAASAVCLGQSDPAEPVAQVVVVIGGGATRGEGGPVFQPVFDQGTLAQSGVFEGDQIVTALDGGAIVRFLGGETILYIGPGSRVLFPGVPSNVNQLSVAVALSLGEVITIQSPSDPRWLVIVGGKEPSRGYTLSRGSTVYGSSDDRATRFGVERGSAVFVSGGLPQSPVTDDSGTLQGRGVTLEKGTERSTEVGADVEPGDPGKLAARRRALAQVQYSSILAQGARWVELAERGDFTPVRGATRASAQLFAPDLETELAFDQPRSAVVAPAPRVVTQPLRTVSVSPVRALLESGIPSSVVVGQRLRRTRIIGNPGTTGGQIRVNPNVEQLIRLPR